MGLRCCFEEDNILHLRPVLCSTLPAIHKKLLDNCTALLCLGFPICQTGMTLKLTLALVHTWRAPDKKHCRSVTWSLCPLPLNQNKRERREAVGGHCGSLYLLVKSLHNVPFCLKYWNF